MYLDSAREMGAILANRRLGLVYGGGRVGLMGAVAEGALQANGRVVGVIPRSLADKELSHRGLSELHVVGSMHERKAMMADIADGFIAMPGGFGTLDELFEIITWAQLGFHRKPIGLLNVAGYFNPLLAFIDHIAQEGFIKPEHLAAVVVAAEPENLLNTLLTTAPPQLHKWLNKPNEL